MGGTITSLLTHADAPAIANSQVEARAVVSKAAPNQSDAAGLQATAFTTALPAPADVTAALNGNPHLQSAFSSAQISALILLGGSAPAGGTAAPQTYTARTSLGLDVSSLSGPHDLLLGLHDPLKTGSALDSVELTLKTEGNVVSDTLLRDVNSALNYFGDRVIDLGAAGGAASPVNLDFSFILTAHNPEDGLLANFVLGTVASAAGDTNHDGQVGFDDLVTLARHYGMATGAKWEDGDFNNDGSVGFDDLVLLARHYGQSLGSVQTATLQPSFRAAVAQAFAQVPEPSTLGLVALAAGGLLIRRRSMAPASPVANRIKASVQRFGQTPRGGPGARNCQSAGG